MTAQLGERGLWQIYGIDGDMTGCAETHCALHAPSAQPKSCSSWDGLDVDLARVLSVVDLPNGCLFLAEVIAPIADRVVRRLPASGLSRDDVIAEVVVDVLSRRSRGSQGVAQLAALARRRALDLVRSSLGRMRCSRCIDYSDRRCRRPVARDGSPHPHTGRVLPEHAEPRRLQPPCREFRDRLRMTSLGEETEHRAAAVAGADADVLAAERASSVREAIAELMVEDPLLGTIAAELLLDGGHTQASLAVRLGLSRDQVKRKLAQANERLRVRLGAFQPEVRNDT